jgi:hypothetical protein
MVGYAIHPRLHLKPVCRDDIIKFAKRYMNVTPRPQYISALLNKHGLTLQVTQARNGRMTSKEVVLDAIETVLEIRGYGFPPHRIIIMDETGLWSNVTKPRTYHFRNWFGNSNSRKCLNSVRLSQVNIAVTWISPDSTGLPFQFDGGTIAISDVSR